MNPAGGAGREEHYYGPNPVSTSQHAPTILNIVRDEQNPLSPHFFDLIFYTKFWQMISRGTLAGKGKLKAWCPEKYVFQIIDCWDNFSLSRLTPKGSKNQSPKSAAGSPGRRAYR